MTGGVRRQHERDAQCDCEGNWGRLTLAGASLVLS